MRTRVTARRRPAVPPGDQRLSHGITSEFIVEAAKKFPPTSLGGHPDEARNPTAGRIIPDKTARASQKTVIGLLRNCHLTT